MEQNHDLQPLAMHHQLETVPAINAKTQRSWLVSPSPSAKPSTHLCKGRPATAVVNAASSQAGLPAALQKLLSSEESHGVTLGYMVLGTGSFFVCVVGPA